MDKNEKPISVRAEETGQDKNRKRVWCW